VARFDIYPNPGQTKKSVVPFLLDVQANLLSGLDSRVVVPLRRVDCFDKVTPVFEVAGVSCFMETPKLAAVPAKILKTPIASLAQHHTIITDALDFLLLGF
jgi:toxin CcdB